MRLRGIVFFMLIIAVILSGCGGNKIKNPLNWSVPDFNYENQNGEEFGLKDLEGKVWMADFIFTNCDDVCWPMTANMKKLQDRAKEEGIENIQFVSFSVDPTVDTPEVLTEFADKFQVDYSNWNFLTGYSQEEIEQFALDHFNEWVKKPESGDQVLHGTSFYLVDQEGYIMKRYTGLNEMPVEEIIRDIQTLQ